MEPGTGYTVWAEIINPSYGMYWIKYEVTADSEIGAVDRALQWIDPAEGTELNDICVHEADAKRHYRVRPVRRAAYERLPS